MKMNIFLMLMLSIGLLFVAQTDASRAQTIPDRTHGSLTKNKPTVVVLRADWCGICQKLEPVIEDLKKEYSGSFDFVAFNITDEQTTAQALEKAKALGISDFFELNIEATATVAIFDGKKLVFQTRRSTDRAEFVAFLDKLIKRLGRSVNTKSD